MGDVIGVRGLTLDAVVGIRAHERDRLQPVEIDIECGLDAEPAALSDKLTDTVSYSDVARAVASVVHGEPHGLLEALAARCIDRVLSDYPVVRTVIIEVRKPNALGGSGIPYVRLTRERLDGHEPRMR